MGKRVLVAMSGGVDSAVAAFLLMEEGYEVIGITMKIWDEPQEAPFADSSSCCGIGGIEDARRVASLLGIPHYVLNMKKPFWEYVIKPFCESYLKGLTPNPCVLCNKFIKFDELLRRAKLLGADFVATGHYARIEYDSKRDRYILKRGRDKARDQSYFLYVMTQAQLSSTLMPVGNFSKEKVRNIARRQGFPVADKPGSQEICFVERGSYAEFVTKFFPEGARPGPIYDTKGRKVGQHKGIAFYTIGQRRGLGVAMGRPIYVLKIDPENNAIIVGEEKQLYKKSLIAGDVNFITIEELKEPMRVQAKIRYMHEEAEALISPAEDGRVRVDFEEPQRAITPGQAVVFYQGDEVVGGGRIEQVIDDEGDS